MEKNCKSNHTRILKHIINVISEVEYCFESATNLFKEMNELNKPLVLTNEVFEFTSDKRDTENDPFKGTSIEGKD